MANNANLKPFRKGHDTRRGRKPKGTKHLSTLIQEMLNDPKFETYVQDMRQGYVLYKGPAVKAIIQVMIVKAIAGDTRACEWIAKHGWGKVEPEHIQPPPSPILITCPVPIGINEGEEIKEEATD